jgi:hypothetical protein
MSILSQRQISLLSFEEKVSLIDELWASMDCSEVGLSLDSAYDKMLERSLADCDHELDVMMTLDKASRQLRHMLQSMERDQVSAFDAA